jgi:hypothetical protein
MYSNHKAPRKVTRRVVLGTAAGAGAVGAAAAIGITQLTGDGAAASNASQTTDTAQNAGTSAIAGDMANGSPVVLFVDTDSREMTLFVDTEEKRVQNATLADLVLKAAGKA